MTNWFFGDSFDSYATQDDLKAGAYWDVWDQYHSPNMNLFPGRFQGGKSLSLTIGNIYKTSNSNDSIHHISMSVYNPQNLFDPSLSRLCAGFKLYDGENIQCSVFFDQLGNIQIYSGDVNGTLIATYLYAMGYVKTWYNFEIEIVISNTTGSITIRKNGNTVPDFTISNVNTRAGSSNSYANKLWLGTNYVSEFYVDDFLWRSDTSSVPWVGDIRCYIRYPSSDVSASWTPSNNVVLIQPSLVGYESGGMQPGGPPNVYYLPFIASYTGSVGTISLRVSTGSNETLQGVVYASANGIPTGSPIATSNSVISPTVGLCNFTFSSPFSVSQDVQYFFAFQCSGTVTYISIISSDDKCYICWESNDWVNPFPVTNPSLTTGQKFWMQVTLTPASGVNAPMVCDTTADGTLSYLSTTSVGAYDFYHVSSISYTPATIVGVVTRGFISKSDSGSRVATVQLKSGSTVVQAPYPSLTVNWEWAWRVDQVDPATGSAWTASAVNNSQIGPILIS